LRVKRNSGRKKKPRLVTGAQSGVLVTVKKIIRKPKKHARPLPFVPFEERHANIKFHPPGFLGWKDFEPPPVTVRRDRYEKFLEWERSNQGRPGAPQQPITTQRIKAIALALFFKWTRKSECSFLSSLPKASFFDELLIDDPEWGKLSLKQARNRLSTFLVRNSAKIEKAFQDLYYLYYTSE
jgi:hypothetical protein